MPRITRWLLPSALTLVVALAAAPSASAASNCQKGRERKLGATYVTKITTKVVTCATGRSITTAFNACRHRNGKPDGRCTSKVKGYACTEKRPSAEVNPITKSYNGYVTCRSGSKSVKIEYQQDR